LLNCERVLDDLTYPIFNSSPSSDTAAFQRLRIFSTKRLLFPES
jgi:hypothetical protein